MLIKLLVNTEFVIAMTFIEITFSLITVETKYHLNDNNETPCFGKVCNLLYSLLLLF